MKGKVDMDAEYYITPQEYEEALENGISAALLNQRIRVSGWDHKRAIETPIKKQIKTEKKYREMAKENGISYATFGTRVRNGWDQERAATTPIIDPEERQKRMIEKIRRIPTQYTELAKKNGMCIQTFYTRVSRGMSLEEAATKPVLSMEKAGRLGVAVRERKRMERRNKDERIKE